VLIAVGVVDGDLFLVESDRARSRDEIRQVNAPMLMDLLAISLAID
jgi:hypothetical protein